MIQEKNKEKKKLNINIPKIKNIGTQQKKTTKSPLFKSSDPFKSKNQHILKKKKTISTNQPPTEEIQPIAQPKETQTIDTPKDDIKDKPTPSKKKQPFSDFLTNLKFQKKPKTLPPPEPLVTFTLTEEELQNLKDTIYHQQGIENIKKWEEVDSYPLNEPYVYASILQHKDTKEKLYFLIEIQLKSEEQDQLTFIKDTFEIMPFDTNNLLEKGEDTILHQIINKIIEDYSLEVSPILKVKMLYFLKKDFLGLGPLEPIMRDVNIEDVSCDGANVPLFVYHRNHGSIQSNVLFEDEETLASFVMKLAQKCGKHISISHPMLDATMPDGSRIQMTLSTEVSTKGSTFTIRKFKEQPFSPADLIQFNTMSSEMMAYLWLAVQYGNSALISGGTASGKTSVLNAISLFIPREAKIVSIEETREINLPHPNWIPGVSRSGFGDVVGGKLTGEIDLFDLMKAALRQRPEYILVGEIRGREAYVLFQAMATGHTTYSTVHADSTKSLIHRLEGEPINIPRIMLQSLDIVCIQSIARVKNKRVRRCKQIIEIIDIDPTTKEILTNEVFRWDPIKDTFAYTGKSYILENIRVRANMKREDIHHELRQRADILDWMVKQKVYNFDEVASVTANYLEKPDEVVEKCIVETHD